MKFESKHFILQEFVPKEIYNVWGEKSAWFIDPRIVEVADGLREYFGVAILINNWHLNGQFKLRGFRPPEVDFGAKLSQHRFGRAIDINVAGHSPKAVYDEILKNEQVFMTMGITTMEDVEDTQSWNHIDIRHTGMNNILIVKP